MKALMTYLLYGYAPGDGFAVRRLTKRGGDLVNTGGPWQHLVRAPSVREAYYLAGDHGLTLSYGEHSAGLIALKRIGRPPLLNMEQPDEESGFEPTTPYLRKLARLIRLREALFRDAAQPPDFSDELIAEGAELLRLWDAGLLPEVSP